MPLVNFAYTGTTSVYLDESWDYMEDYGDISYICDGDTSTNYYGGSFYVDNTPPP